MQSLLTHIQLSGISHYFLIDLSVSKNKLIVMRVSNITNLGTLETFWFGSGFTLGRKPAETFLENEVGHDL